MKTYYTILIVLISTVAFSQQKFSEASMIKTSDSLITISDNRIDNSKTKETIQADKGNMKITEYFDNENILVKKITSSLDNAYILFGSKIEVYNKKNEIIVEKNLDANNVIWHITLFEYIEGQLEIKTTFNAVHIYMVRYVIGKGKNETFSIFYDVNGKKANPNSLPMRKEPYNYN